MLAKVLAFTACWPVGMSIAVGFVATFDVCVVVMGRGDHLGYYYHLGYLWMLSVCLL